MKNIFNKLILGILFISSLIVNGQIPPPPTPKEEAGGAIGAFEPGVSIDMYSAVLALVAITFIVYFVREYSSKRKLA